MGYKLITPTYFNGGQTYIYFSDGEETGKAMYMFFVSGNKITKFMPLRYLGKKPTIVLPLNPTVYIPQNASRKEMQELEKQIEQGKKEHSFFFEANLHKNQRYVSNDEMDNMIIGEGVFKDYNNITIIHPSKCPLTWEEGAFKKYAHVNFVAPEGATLKVVEFSYPIWNKNNKKVYEKQCYPLIGNESIFMEIDGYTSTSKERYKFVPQDKINLPLVTINEKQCLRGREVVDLVPENTQNETLLSDYEIYDQRDSYSGGPSKEIINQANKYLKGFPDVQEIVKLLFTKSSSSPLTKHNEYFSLNVEHKEVAISLTTKGRFTFYIENEFESFGVSANENDVLDQDGSKMSFYMAGDTQKSSEIVETKELFNKFSEDDKDSFNELVSDTLEELQNKYLYDEQVM